MAKQLLITKLSEADCRSRICNWTERDIPFVSVWIPRTALLRRDTRDGFRLRVRRTWGRGATGVIYLRFREMGEGTQIELRPASHPFTVGPIWYVGIFVLGGLGAVGCLLALLGVRAVGAVQITGESPIAGLVVSFAMMCLAWVFIAYGKRVTEQDLLQIERLLLTKLSASKPSERAA